MKNKINKLLGLFLAAAVAGLLAFDSEGAPIQFQGKSYKQISSLTKFSFKAQIDTLTLISQVMEFDVKPGAVSFGINVIGGTDYLYVYELISPSGEKVIDPTSAIPTGLNTSYRPQIFSKNRLFPEEDFKGVLSAVIPTHPDVKVIPGKWKLRIASQSLGMNNPMRDVYIVIKELVSPISPSSLGILSLNFYLAPDNTLMQFMNAFKSNQNLGISLAAITLKPAFDFFLENQIGLVIKSISAIGEEYNKAHKPKDQEPNKEFLDLMNNFTSPGEMSTFFLRPANEVYYDGIAPLFGSVASLTTQKFSSVIVQSPKYNLQLTFAHEVAHSLGLFHTNVDNLVDTEDPAHLFEGHQGYEPNLMNIKPSKFELSASQRRLILLNPAIPIYEPVN